MRSVNEERLTRTVEKYIREAVEDSDAESRFALAEEAIETVKARLRSYLDGQGRVPRLIGATAAAKLLGVQPPHLARLKAQGRMPEGIPVEGTNDVYVREEVEALGVILAGEREARRRRREERDAAA